MKTPTPRYLAARLILKALQGVELTTSNDNIVALVPGCKVSDEKRGKVMEQVKKITDKFVLRCQKIVDGRVTKPE